MAEDFRNDPEYRKTVNTKITSNIKSFAWGAATAGLIMAAPFTYGISLAPAVYTGYKSWSAGQDSKLADEAVNAKLTAKAIAAEMQKSGPYTAVDMTPDAATGHRDRLAAQQAAAQAAGAQR